MNPVSDSKFNQAEHIARALYDFFSEKEKPELHPLLRKVLHQLVTLQMEKGRGFLTKDEMDEISDDPRTNVVGKKMKIAHWFYPKQELISASIYMNHGLAN